MKYIFLDTNIFIHFQFYEQIPWQEIVGDEYNLIIAPIVLDELDKHKTSSNKKIAGRIKNILPKIEQGQTTINGIINACLPVPKDETFSKFNLSRSQQDHALLSAILEFGEQNGSENIIFISHDTGPRMRARQLGISVIELEEKYLLPEEDSQEEKELKKLRKENAELKNNLPKVELTLNDGNNFKQVELTPLLQTEDDYCEKELKHIKEKHSPFTNENTIENDTYTNTSVLLESLVSNKRRLNSLFAAINQPTIEQKERYNQELETFYAEYEKIVKEKYKWDKILSNAVLLNLDISNNGTAPANDIDVFLIFPDSVKILLYDDFPRIEKPKQPYKPKHAGDIDMSEYGINSILNPPAIEYIYIMDKSVIKKTIKCCNLEYANGNIIVQYKYSNSLKHNLHFSLEPIWVLCRSNFKVKYELLISNYPKQIEGELNISITTKAV